MKKYSVQPLYAGFDAMFKAKTDACKILEGEGYEPFKTRYRSDMPAIKKGLLGLLDMFRLLLLPLKRDDILLIQWPPCAGQVTGLLYGVVRLKCRHLYLLIHDLEVLRGNWGGLLDYTMKFIHRAERVIVHTPAMRDYLVERGVSGEKLRVLECFDYLTDDTKPVEREREREREPVVVFAGTLQKSAFLWSMAAADLGLTVNCYGAECPNLPAGLTYKCKFHPDNVGVLEGSWGLVWDGDSVDGCTGAMGEYLRYNASHKLSLYIVAELPVIVWKESAVAKYVEEKGIGICVGSLREIRGRIDGMSDEEYGQMIVNIRKEAAELKRGAHLRRCLE